MSGLLCKNPKRPKFSYPLNPSRVFKTPRETKTCSRNQEFEYVGQITMKEKRSSRNEYFAVYLLSVLDS